MDDTTGKEAIAASEVDALRRELAEVTAERDALLLKSEEDRWRFDVDKEPLPMPMPGRTVRLWDGRSERVLSIPGAWAYNKYGHLKAWRPAYTGPTDLSATQQISYRDADGRKVTR